MNLPKDIHEAAKELLSMETERDALYEEDKHDAAFALEQEQRASGLLLADWLLNNHTSISD
jgi:hypothetical protein